MFIAEPLQRLSLATVLVVSGCFGQAFGSWKLNAARSTFAGDIRPKSLTVRIEPHARGEAVPLDRTEVNGQTTSSSMVLYLDGIARDFQLGGSFATQSSPRIDIHTMEIMRNCSTSGLT